MSNLNTAPPGALEILEKCKTVDGAGSGLDADLLIGKTIKQVCFSVSSGTPSIQSSFGISGITDLGVGQYDIVYSAAFANEYVNMSGTAKRVSSAAKSDIIICHDKDVNISNSHASICTFDIGGNVRDPSDINLIFVGD
jgi:hypothetical protein